MSRTLVALALLVLVATVPPVGADEQCFDTEELVCYDPHPQPQPFDPVGDAQRMLEELKDRLP